MQADKGCLEKTAHTQCSNREDDLLLPPECQVVSCLMLGHAAHKLTKRFSHQTKSRENEHEQNNQI
jgi:hypothetical protein